MISINKIIDENYFDLIVSNNLVHLYANGDNVTPLNGTHSMIQISGSNFNECILGVYPYHFFPSIYTLNSGISLERSGIPKVQCNTNLALYGQGVLIAVIDTGIDYQHEAFMYKDKTTRIISIWDQTIEAENLHPKIFPYGSEYSREMINLALRDDNPYNIVPSIDEIGHGTMLAGIIAGNPSPSNDFSGVVPQSELIIVKLKQAKSLNRKIFGIKDDVICYEETDLIAGLRYVFELAQQLRRPLAICVGMGTSQGGHDGREAMSSYLNLIAQTPHFGVTVAAGNESDKGRHFEGIIEENGYLDFELNISEQDKSFSLEIWVNTPSKATLEITSPTGEKSGEIYPGFNECRRINFILELSKVWVNNIISETESGEQLILVRFLNPHSGIWRFRVRSNKGYKTVFNAWLPSGNIISTDTYFLLSSPNKTVMSPGNARFPLVVTSYNPNNNSIVIGSGRGFARDNEVTPDLAAPGFEMVCTVPGNQYAVVTGTGAAAAHAAGIIAMILEWAVVKGNYTSVVSSDINGLLVRGAVRDPNITYPNTIWGYGIIDIYGFFQGLTQ